MGVLLIVKAGEESSLWVFFGFYCQQLQTNLDAARAVFFNLSSEA